MWILGQIGKACSRNGRVCLHYYYRTTCCASLRPSLICQVGNLKICKLETSLYKQTRGNIKTWISYSKNHLKHILVLCVYVRERERTLKIKIFTPNSHIYSLINLDINWL